MAPVVGFYSYAREDDALTGGAVSELHARLEDRIRLRLPAFRLFQDVRDIEAGDVWEDRLRTHLDAAVFFFPVLTPHFFERLWCRTETERFLDRYDGQAVRLNVIPLYLVEDEDFDLPALRRDDALRERLAKLQFASLREHVAGRWVGEAAKAAIEKIAERVVRLAKLAEVQRKIAAIVNPLLAAGGLDEAERCLRENRQEGEADIVARVRELGVDAAIREAEERVAGFVGVGWAAYAAGLRAGVENERRARERAAAEAERREAERVEAERAAAERLSAERAAAEKAAAQKLAAERVAAERLAAEKAAAQKREAERLATAKLAAAKAAAAKLDAEKAAATRPGARRVLRIKGVDLDLAYIPAGTFRMGSPEGVGESYERPQHDVRITRPYWMGVFPVTQDLWAAVATEAQLPPRPSRFSGDRRPVERVSWFDVVRWCNAASALVGLTPAYRIGDGEAPKVDNVAGATGLRLPTEAEWEYACRAGTTTQWSFGDDAARLPEHGWFGDNSGAQTHPVGEKVANPWGLHDLHGNVWEWCDDGSRGYGAAPAVDRAGARADRRVIRGGSWSGSAGGCRSACRNDWNPVVRYDHLGFRVVLAAPAP